MKWIIRAYAVILLAYTGWRTYDFMLNQLPSGDTSTLLALLFLFATEAGLLLWHEVSINHSTTREQHQLSVTLTWTDFVGSLGAGIADMILRQTFYGNYVMPPLFALILLYGLPILVALNVAAVLLYLSNDGETQIKREKQELKFEITKQALDELRNNKVSIAKGLKDSIYRELRDDVTDKIEKEYLKQNKRSIPVASSGNGHLPETIVFNAEAKDNSKNAQ